MTIENKNRLKFSVQRLEALPPATDRTVYFYDTECRGLALSVGKSGRKTFLLYKKVRGQPRRISIGPFPAVSVEQARKRGAQLAGEIALGLSDGSSSGSQRFSEAFTSYMKEHSEPGKRSTKEDEALYYRNLTGKRTTQDSSSGKSRNWIDLSGYKLTDISGHMLRQLHRDMSVEAPIAANRTLALVSSVFTHAIREGRYDKLNPCRAVKRNRENSRERFLSKEEAKWLLASLDHEPDRDIGDLVRLALATGARRGNILSMQTSDIDLDLKTWRIGITKNGSPQTLPLAPSAVEVLQRRLEAPSELPNPQGWVFPSSGKSGHLVEPKKGWKRLLERATALRLRELLAANRPSVQLSEVPLQVCREFPKQALSILTDLAEEAKLDVGRHTLLDLRLHDLRRTVGSWLASSGVSLPLIGRVLNHKSTQSTQVYARFMIDPVRNALDEVAASLAASRE